MIWTWVFEAEAVESLGASALYEPHARPCTLSLWLRSDRWSRWLLCNWSLVKWKACAFLFIWEILGLSHDGWSRWRCLVCNVLAVMQCVSVFGLWMRESQSSLASHAPLCLISPAVRPLVEQHQSSSQRSVQCAYESQMDVHFIRLCRERMSHVYWRWLDRGFLDPSTLCMERVSVEMQKSWWFGGFHCGEEWAVFEDASWRASCMLLCSESSYRGKKHANLLDARDCFEFVLLYSCMKRGDGMSPSQTQCCWSVGSVLADSADDVHELRVTVCVVSCAAEPWWPTWWSAPHRWTTWGSVPAKTAWASR